VAYFDERDPLPNRHEVWSSVSSREAQGRSSLCITRIYPATLVVQFVIVPGIDNSDEQHWQSIWAMAFPDWPFPQGDVWLLRYHGSEIDHGTLATGPPYEANLDTWVKGASIHRQDVVWYGAHVTHDVAHEPPGTVGHVAGPELRPVNW
jgi:Serine hydrolase